jgi:GTP-binding protein
MADIYDALSAHVVAHADEAEGAQVADAPLQLAIVGRPNVGKSTLVNRLIGDERVVTGPEVGITRDAISVDWSWAGHPVRLVDTAGLRRKARVTAKLETMAVEDSLRAIRLAQVVVLVIDATVMMERQDLSIGSHVIEEGRALVVAVNKWDLITGRNAALRQLRDRMETSFPQARGVPVVTLSALSGRGAGKLLPAVLRIYEVWNQRLGTGVLNRWLNERLEAHPPPVVAGRRLRLRYITQAKSRPPTFVLFANRPQDLPVSYERYLINGLRDDFALIGVPIRLILRKGWNPYAKKES